MFDAIRWRTIRTKIIVWAFVPTAIVLAAVAGFIVSEYQTVTEDLVIERNQELTRVSTGELAAGLTDYTGRLAEYTGLLAELARTTYVVQDDPAAQQEALERAGGRFESFDAGVLIISNRGKVVAAEPERSDAVGHNWSDRSYFRQMLRAPEPTFSNVTTDGPDGAEVLVVAVPISGAQGQFLGIIAGMFHLGAETINRFYRDLEKLQIRESASAYLVDGNGRVLFHTDSDHIGEDFSAQQAVQQVSERQVGAFRTKDIDGREIVASYAPVPSTPWGLVTEENWSSLISPGQTYRRFLLLLLALGVVVPALVVAIGVRRITRPITELIGAAQEVAGGNFGQTITAHTGDEIEELSKQFNLMSAKLRESYAKLEKRVASRTKELATLNTIAASVSRSQDLGEVLNHALAKTLEVMEIEAGGIYLFDRNEENLHLAAQQGYGPDLAGDIDTLRVGEGFSGFVAQSGQPMVVRDVSTDPRLTKMAVRDDDFHSLASVPLHARGQVLGTLFTATRGYREFTDQDVQLLTSIGHQVGVAIDNARLLDAERRRRQEATLLSEMAKLISGTLDVDEVLGLTAEYAVDVFGVDCCSILLLDDKSGLLRPATEIVLDHFPAGNVGDVEFAPSDRLRKRVFEDLQALIIEDVPAEPHLTPHHLMNLQSALIVPVEVGGRSLGAMQLGTYPPTQRRFTSDEGELALAMANQAAVAIENARLFKAEQRRAEQFKVISQVGRRITSILAVDELLDQMAQLIHEAFNYYHVGFGLIEGDVLVSRAGAGPLWSANQSLRLKVGQEGIMGWVAQSGKPLLAPDVDKEPRYLRLQEAAGTRSELCVPLKTKESIIGVLDVQSNHLNAFDDSDLNVLQSLASQAAVAIENARLFRNATRQVRELRALADASRIISSVLEQDELLQMLYEQITRIAPTDFYAIALYDEATNIVSIEINVDEGVHYPKERYVLDRGLLTLVIHNRQPLLFHSLADEKRELDVETVPCGSAKHNHGWLGVPMLYGQKVLGAIIVGSYQRGAFDEGHQQILSSIANQAAVAVENARLYEQAQQLAVIEERSRLARDLHDAVTQTLFSASLIAEALPSLWESDQDEGRALLKELRQLSRGALAEMRTLLLELRPATLVEASIADLLRQLAESVTGRTGLPVTVMVDRRLRLPSEVHVALYRISQEALNNVVKHAHANNVTVSLQIVSQADADDSVELRVSDDGQGFDPDSIAADRLGLRIIRERARAIGARYTVNTQPGEGTQVMVLWNAH